MPSAKRLLIIEDTANMAALYKNYLKIAGYESDIAEDGQKGLAMLSQNAYDGVILDLHLPDMHGLEILKHIRKHYDDLPVIVITGYGSISVAVESMRLGAHDFITKPFSASRLNTKVHIALEHQSMKRELKELRRSVYQSGYQHFIGSSPVMQAVFRQIEAVAPSKASVFISGESGTGKELVAEAIHRASPRVPKSFIAMNCAAIPNDLLESELFGHVKGAFTGATQDRKGAAAVADGGTLFLDEVCEMAPELQAKILRFVQTGTFTPVGSTEVEKVDVRIICATNRNAAEEVAAGRFREDLYYRLHVIPLEVPPLRERDGDVIELANAFLKRYAAEEGKHFESFDPSVIALFRSYEWPGNVRELQNVIQQVVLMGIGPVVTFDMLPETLRTAEFGEEGKKTPAEDFVIQPLWMIEKDAIMKAIKACQDDVPSAAAMLEISPSTIYRKLHAWRILESGRLIDVAEMRETA